MTLGTTTIEEASVIVGGARIHYQRAGTGRPLLLLHGLVGSSKNWRRNIGFLAQNSSVYAFDNFNMGQSDRVPGLDAGLEATADRLASYMDALGIDQADVAGHSHGGAVAMMFAARHLARVRRLILFAPANPYCDLGKQLISFYQSRFGTWFARQIPWMPRSCKRIALSRMYGDPARISDDSLDGYTQGLGIPGTIDHVLQIVRRWSADMKILRSVLSRVATKPVLLIWGDCDRAVGLNSARDLQHKLPQSRLLVLPGVGHIAFEEMPDICNQAMSDWIVAPSLPDLRQSTLRSRPVERATTPRATGAA